MSWEVNAHRLAWLARLMVLTMSRYEHVQLSGPALASFLVLMELVLSHKL